MEDLGPSFILQAEGILREQLKRTSFSLQSILKLLVEKGFISTRHYEISSDIAFDHDEFLTLVDFAYGARERSPAKGYRIPFIDTTLGTSGSTHRPAYGSASEASDTRQFSWIKDLNLEGKQWIDFPIVASSDKIVGVIAVSWKGSKDLVTRDTEAALSTVCRLIAFYQERFDDLNIQRIEKSLVTTIAQISRGDNAESVQEKITELVGEHLNAKAVALFRYDWIRDDLVKTFELLDNRPSDFSESADQRYHVGDYLTGKSWRQPEFRHILNFEKFRVLKGAHIETGSLERHARLLGGIETVLYGQIGSYRERYYIRLMNRRDEPALGFTNSQKETLDAICERLSEALDTTSVKKLLGEIEQAAIVGLRDFPDIEAAFLNIAAKLELFGIKEFLVVHSGSNSRIVNFSYVHGSWLPETALQPMVRADEGSLIAELSVEAGIRVMRLDRFKSAESEPLAQTFLSNGTKVLVVICARHDHARTLILVPDRSPSSRGATQGLKERISELEQTGLLAIAAIVGAAIEAAASSVSAEKAEMLVAQFGHEVGTPMAKLGQMAIAGINRAAQAIRDYKKAEVAGTISGLEELKRRIDAQSQYLRHQMDIAIAMAEQSKGFIQLSFEQFRWLDVVNEAWEEALSWAFAVESRQAYRRIVLRPNDAIKAMEGVGDKSTLKIIFSNLLKNAIKYSLPRYRNEPMFVDVLGQPQTGWHIVQVQNWGVGIEPAKRDAIFRRFYRIERVDRIRAIRGIGLGLYLARTIAELHRGEVFCRDSQATLDDRQRTEAAEGFLTTFELRVPRTLPVGMFEATLYKV